MPAVEVQTGEMDERELPWPCRRRTDLATSSKSSVPKFLFVTQLAATGYGASRLQRRSPPLQVAVDRRLSRYRTMFRRSPDWLVAVVQNVFLDER